MKKTHILNKLERITLALFLTCMVITASMFIAGIWIQPDNEAYFMSIATFFVVGLGNFLIWIPLIVYRFLNKLR